MDDTCKRAGKWFRHCDWVEIYDVEKPSEELESTISNSWELPRWLAELGVVRKTYVGSRCDTCGRYIPRDTKDETAD